MSVNSDISGEAGGMAALPEEEGEGCHDWLFREDFQLKNLMA